METIKRTAQTFANTVEASAMKVVNRVKANKRVVSIMRTAEKMKTAMDNSPLCQRTCKVLNVVGNFLKKHNTLILTVAVASIGIALSAVTLGVGLPLAGMVATTFATPVAFAGAFSGMLALNGLAGGLIGAAAGQGMDRAINGNRYADEKGIAGFFKRNIFTIGMGTIGALSAPVTTIAGCFGAIATTTSAMGALGIMCATNAVPFALLGGLAGCLKGRNEQVAAEQVTAKS